MRIGLASVDATREMRTTKSEGSASEEGERSDDIEQRRARVGDKKQEGFYASNDVVNLEPFIKWLTISSLASYD